VDDLPDVARRRSVVAIALIAVCAVVAPSSSTARSTVAPLASLSISPAIIDVVEHPGSALPSIRIVNGTSVKFALRVYPALVKQHLDGSLTIRSSAAQLTIAKHRFALTPEKLVLAPGASTVVTGQFLGPAKGAPGAYGAAVIDAVPEQGSKRAPAFRLRLLGALLVAMPDAPAPTGRIETLRVRHLRADRTRLIVRVHNTGRVHGYVTEARMRLRGPYGNAIPLQPLREGVILPHFRRDFRTEIRKRLAPGRYTLTAWVTFGTRHLSRTTHFRIAA
jgi:hypothetical protein